MWEVEECAKNLFFFQVMKRITAKKCPFVTKGTVIYGKPTTTYICMCVYIINRKLFTLHFVRR